jgi:uncharacterized protein with HEPN domain
MDGDQATYLRDILESAELILEYTRGMDRERFLADPKTQDAVLRRFEILGEAASHPSAETRSLFPDIPFHKMRGMRNIIAHAYGAVDLEVVWRTVEEHIPPIKEAIESALQK